MASNTIEFDADKAKDYDERAHAFSNKVVQVMETFAWFPSSSRMLDFGCGTGLTTIALARHVQSVDALDISENMLQFFRLKLGSAPSSMQSKITLIHQSEDTNGESLSTGAYDVIVLSFVLHHVHGNQERIMANLTRAMAPNGRICIFEFDDTPRSKQTREKGFGAKKQTEQTGVRLNHHVHEHKHAHDWLGKDELSNLVKQNGFFDVEDFGEFEVKPNVEDDSATMDCYYMIGQRK